VHDVYYEYKATQELVDTDEGWRIVMRSAPKTATAGHGATQGHSRSSGPGVDDATSRRSYRIEDASMDDLLSLVDEVEEGLVSG
jgi:hypothetical protein